MLVLLSLAATLGAVLLSSTVAAVACAIRQYVRLIRRAEARADEVALIAASAQRWHAARAEWGGGGGAFAGASFRTLGLPTNPLAPSRRRTRNGVYRIIHVPACDTLDRAAMRTGVETGRDGLVVVGWDPVTGDATAAIVLGPLVQVPLARVPWTWIAALDAETSARVNVAIPAEAIPASATPIETAPVESVLALPEAGRVRSRVAAAPDRLAVPALPLVHWPDRPAHPTIGQAPDRAPPEPGWRRAA